MKDEDGTDIKLTVLKTPIPLEQLEYECMNINDFKDRKNKIPTKKRRRKGDVNKEEEKKEEIDAIQAKLGKSEGDEISSVTLLKEPIPLDNFEEDAMTINVKTIQGTYRRASIKRPKENVDTWKENAIILFEYSYIYPFIHASNKYKCFFCSKNFLEASSLKNHTLFEHSIEEMKQAINNRSRDRNFKVDVSTLQCRICLETLKSLQLLKNHLKEHGKNIDLSSKDNIIPFKLGGNDFECQICGEVFLKLRLLIIHMSTHFNNYSCEICGSVFVSLILLRRHQTTHESGSFPCEKCNKVFTNSAKRLLHMRGVHLKRFPRRCPICPERFNSNYQRTKHLRVVHNQTSGLFRCETCGKEYDIKYHLLIHIRSVHLQERNQECSICNARFFSKYCLTRHMVIHTGEKNFKCEICGKAYARRKNLREHSKTHELGLVVCNVCGRNCLDHANLISHMNAVHGIL